MSVNLHVIVVYVYIAFFEWQLDLDNNMLAIYIRKNISHSVQVHISRDLTWRGGGGLCKTRTRYRLITQTPEFDMQDKQK